MAKITELTVINPADKARQYAVLTGKGAVADTDDPIVTNTHDFPVGSQYTDLTNKKFYVRTGKTGTAVADWTAVNPS